MKKNDLTAETIEKEKNSANKSKINKAQKQSGLHEGHRQRMFSKYITNGIESLEEHEILEMALYSVFTRINTNEIAHMLLNRFTTILGVFNATISELCEIPKINELTAIKIKFYGDLFKYVGKQTAKVVRFERTTDFVEYGRKFIEQENREILLMLFLDQNNNLVSRSVCTGYSDNVKTNIRMILKHVNETDCKKLVLIHNHLNDHITPSSSDIKSTRQLKDLLLQINVTLVDHIILGTNNTYRSFHEEKIIEGL